MRHVCNAVRGNDDNHDNHNDNHDDDNDDDNHDDDNAPTVRDLHVRAGVRIRRRSGRELHGWLRLRLLDERRRRDCGPLYVDRDDVELLLRIDDNDHHDHHDHHDDHNHDNNDDVDDNDDRRPVVRSFFYSG